jgi:hypothetical protein
LSPDPESGENYFGTSGEFYFGIDKHLRANPRRHPRPQATAEACMTAIISKPAQNRLDKCALARPKWAKIRKPRRKPTRGTLRIDILVADAAVRVENAQQNGQTRGKTKLLGKYRLNQNSLPRKQQDAVSERDF